MKNYLDFSFQPFPFDFVVTHAGTFHADEILALATVKFFTNGFVNSQSIIRTFDFSEHLANPKSFLVDIGREFTPENGNFDHHQDPSLPAANILVLRYLLQEGKQRDYMEEYLYNYVSECDKGGETLQATPTLPSIIRGLNNVSDGFHRAFDICLSAVYSAYCTAAARIESEERWEKVEKIGKIAITDSADHIVGWHQLAEKDSIVLLVTPNVRGGYQITSRSTDVFVIPAHPSQSFRHNSGFLAAYETKEAAIAHAKEII